ncbi:tripartite-type tricarboxylate transporter receptor subunit TctC [Advenella incenata]|uniref:Tripartite-type tricarboxylate transporter receptor subunit TctC n=2 Tax=Advenella incenata TaxID=267800 RepID=A0A4V2FTY2_9BURK|nr:tripartite-type tricarboxylate transporter receptor subunit TctC [Advenella incenata]
MCKARSVFTWLIFRCIAACTSCFLMGAPAFAGDWPNQPVRLISPFPAGGTADILSRSLGQELSEQWKQTIVVENKVGAGGAVAASQVARARPDGYTMLMVSGSMLTVNPNLYKNLPYRVDDFKNVSIVSIGPFVVATNKKVPANNLVELLSYIRQNKSGVNFGSSGVGSQTHMASEMLMHETGSKMTHIPYSGETLALTDLIAGQLQVVTGNLAALMPFIKSGDVKAIAVTSSERSAALADVPTVKEQLDKEFDAQGWFGVVVPKGTPDDIVDKMEQGIKTAMASERMTKKFQDLGLTAAEHGQAYMTQRITNELASWKTIIAEQKINPK